MSPSATEVVQHLLDLEDKRCDALARLDIPALREILSPRLIHVHTRGNRDTLESYLEFLTTKVEIISVTRSELEVEVAGDCAVMTGHQRNQARPRNSDESPREVNAKVIQVWVREDADWKQLALQATAVGAPPPPPPD